MDVVARPPFHAISISARTKIRQRSTRRHRTTARHTAKVAFCRFRKR
ncbi:hypothetical protein Agau_C101181 [Agrobacterium tumefaciens F2]|nr:hypothetical protein Agau_C101181 [Agrobacterium tumefaciens F2]